MKNELNEVQNTNRIYQTFFNKGSTKKFYHKSIDTFCFIALTMPSHEIS